MYLFSYGSNTHEDHLKKFVKAMYITNGTLKDYKLYFNHLFIYANIMKEIGKVTHGTIHKIASITDKLEAKEIFCKLIDVDVLGDDKKNYKCKTYISKLPLINLFVLPYYKKLLEEGYKHRNLVMPAINSLYLFIIHCFGLIFGMYLLFYTKYKYIGMILVFIDFSLVLDHMLEYNVYNSLRSKYKLLTKIKIFIPFVLLITYLIYL